MASLSGSKREQQGSMPGGMFGERLPGKRYIHRPGAYAVILDDEQRIATLQTPSGYFLPGGGCESDEDPATAIQREVLEECGYKIEIRRLIGEAGEFIYARDEDQFYQIQAAFFEAVLGEQVSEFHEADHTLRWLDPAAAVRMLRRQSQAWAVQLVMNRSIGASR